MFLMDRFFDGAFLTFGLEVIALYTVQPPHIITLNNFFEQDC